MHVEMVYKDRVTEVIGITSHQDALAFLQLLRAMCYDGRGIQGWTKGPVTVEPEGNVYHRKLELTVHLVDVDVEPAPAPE